MDPNLLRKIEQRLPSLPPEVQQKLGGLVAEARRSATRQLAKTDFMAYVRYVWPNFIHGRHHEKMAEAFQRVAEGQVKRLIINMPPRHTKSEFASYLLPSWFLGKYPGKKIIQTSHTAELAVGFGRKVRNLVDSDRYKDVFPEVALQADSKAAGRWATNYSGEYFAIGVGGAVTGKGADLLIIDDPHSEQEATLAEVNPEVYDKTYEWYTSGPRQRLQPGGAIVVVMCMTGDTPVMHGNGSEVRLDSLKIGDDVATYDGGRLTTSKILNFQSNGVDDVFTIRTQSGRILRANERHPFLVEIDGVHKWIRLKDLAVGMSLVALKAAIAQPDRSVSPISAPHVRQKLLITESTQTPPMSQWDTTGNSVGFSVATTGVGSQQKSKDNVLGITTSVGGQRGIEQLHMPQTSAGMRGSNPVTVSLKQTLTESLKAKAGCALSAVSLRLTKILGRIGTGSSVSTTATTQEKSEGYSVTTAISQSDIQRPQLSPMPLPDISDFTTDLIESITYSGREEVFDLQIERTENFIANGVVSHNTRWSKKDLTGQVLKAAAQRSGEDWEVIEFPAILPSGVPLWPQFWRIEELEALRQELPNSKWMAQYQQQPTSDVSAIIKRDWWQVWDSDEPPFCSYLIQSWDTAFLKSERADYSACTTWGIFEKPDDTGKNQTNIILLNAIKDRMEFPELKQRAFEEYKYWNPDSLIVEAKAAGSPLLFELRAMGIPVQEFTPSRGNDKIARLNAVADLFASGRVWVPNTHWAEELVEEVASFPSGEHDDLVDSMTQALLRYRQGGFLRLTSDEPEPVRHFKRRREGYY